MTINILVKYMNTLKIFKNKVGVKTPTFFINIYFILYLVFYLMYSLNAKYYIPLQRLITIIKKEKIWKEILI